MMIDTQLSPALREINISLAAFPGLAHLDAALAAIDGVRRCELSEPAFGPLSICHMQLVPQNRGQMTESFAQSLCDAYPDVKFRLHANVRVLQRAVRADLSGFDEHFAWFEQAGRINRLLGAAGYTAHSGYRAESSMLQMLDNARRCADLFECRVGIEGQYPTQAGELLVASWAEYRQLFESGLDYALDLSHLNILVAKTRVREDALVAEMLSSAQCIEVHISDNDGSGDWHQTCERRPWWADLLMQTHPDAVIFSEGNQMRKRVSPVVAEMLPICN